MNWYQNMPSKGRKISHTRQQALYNTMVYDLEFLDNNVRDVSTYFTDGMVIGCLVKETETGFEIEPGAVGYKGKILPLSGTYELSVPVDNYICYTGDVTVVDEPEGTVIAKKTETGFDYSCREFNVPDVYARLAIINTMKDIDAVRADFVYIKSTEGLYVRNQRAVPSMNTIHSGDRIIFNSMDEMPINSTRIYKSKDYGITMVGGIALVNSIQPFRFRIYLNGNAVGEAAFSSTAESHYEPCRLIAPMRLNDGYNRITLSYVPEEEIEVTVKSSAILGG